MAGAQRLAVVGYRSFESGGDITMKLARLAGVTVVLLGGAVVGHGQGADYTQWRGPNRDGSVASFTEPRAWPEQLTQRWKVEVGTGYATPILVGNRVYVFARLERPGDDAGAGRRQRQGAVAHRLSRGLHDALGDDAARRRPQVHARLRQRPAVQHRHDRHRDRVGRGQRQAAVAEARLGPGADVHHALVLADRGRRPGRSSTSAAT